MKSVIIDLKAIIEDCKNTDEFGSSQEVLKELDGKTINVLDIEEYDELIFLKFDKEDGDVFGIDFDKYDYVYIPDIKNLTHESDVFSLKDNWVKEA